MCSRVAGKRPKEEFGASEWKFHLACPQAADKGGSSTSPHSRRCQRANAGTVSAAKMLCSTPVRQWHTGSVARLTAAPKAVAPAVSTAVVAATKTPYERRQSRHFRLRKRVSAPAAAAHVLGFLDVIFGHGMLTGGLSPTQVSGTPERPRLAVFRSNQHIYAQARAQRRPFVGP